MRRTTVPSYFSGGGVVADRNGVGGNHVPLVGLEGVGVEAGHCGGGRVRQGMKMHICRN